MAKDTRGLTNASTAITLGSSGQGPVILPEDLRGGGIGNYTTTERNAISGQRVDNNMLIYNTTTSQYERYSGGTRAATGFMTGGTWSALNLSEGGHTSIQTYADSTAYSDNDIVYYETNNSLYIATADIAASNTTDPDANSSFTRISNPVNTTYTAGTGLTLTGTEFSLNALHMSDTVVFEAATLAAGITARNAARAAGWAHGDIAVIIDDDPDSGTDFDPHSYIYVGATNNNTAATTNDDWAQLTFTTDTDTTYTFNDTANSGTTLGVDFTTTGTTITATVDASGVNSDTTYTAGNGLTLTGTEFTANAHTGITVDADGISVTNPANDSTITISSTGDVTANSTFSTNQSADETITLSIAGNAVGTDELNVAGQGTEHQLLASDGDGSFSWVSPGADHGVYDTTVTLTGDVTDATFTLNNSAAQSVTLSLADNSVDNAAMADDAIGIAELSASGTASATTYLRGDNTWAGFDHVIPGLSDVFELRQPAPADAIQRAAALPEASLIGATPPYWRFWDGSSTPPTGLSAVVPSTWGGFFGTGSTYPFFVLSSSETRSDWADGLNRNDARTLYAYRDATNWAVWTITGTTDPVDSVVTAFGGHPAIALTNDTGVTYTLANSMGTPGTGNVQWVFDFNSEGDVVDIILDSQDTLYLGNNGNSVEWRELPDNEIHIFSTTTAYATGDFVYYADRRKLYRISSPVAASNTLTPNNNPSFQEVAGSLKTYSDSTPYASGEIVYYFGDNNFYRATAAIPASNTTDPNANSSFTKIHQFDLHDDVTTALVGNIAFEDRFVISDESATGDPNSWVDFQTLVGSTGALLDGRYEPKFAHARVPVSTLPTGNFQTGASPSVSRTGAVSVTGAGWGFSNPGTGSDFSGNYITQPTTWTAMFGSTAPRFIISNGEFFANGQASQAARFGHIGNENVYLLGYRDATNWAIWRWTGGVTDTHNNVSNGANHTPELVNSLGTPGTTGIRWMFNFTNAVGTGSIVAVSTLNNDGSQVRASNDMWVQITDTQLDATNTPTAGQVLSAGSGGAGSDFTWVDADGQVTRTNIEEQIGDTDILLTTAVFNNESDEVPTSPFDTSDLRFFGPDSIDGSINPITDREQNLSTVTRIIFYPQTDTPMQDVLNRVTTSSLIRLTAPAVPAPAAPLTDNAIPARSIIFRPTAVTLTPASNAIQVDLTTASTLQISDGDLGRLFGFTPSANWTVSVKLDDTLIHGDEIIPNTIGYDRLSTAAVAEIREGVQTDNPRLVVEAFRQAEVKTITYNTDGTIFTTLADVGFSAATDIRAYYTYTGDNLTQVRYFNAATQNSVTNAPAAGAAGLLATKTLTYTGDNITLVSIT